MEVRRRAPRQIARRRARAPDLRLDGRLRQNIARVLEAFARGRSRSALLQSATPGLALRLALTRSPQDARGRRTDRLRRWSVRRADVGRCARKEGPTLA